jgi:hypothetical protein
VLLALALIVWDRLRKRGAKAGSREEFAAACGETSLNPTMRFYSGTEIGIIHEPLPVYQRRPDTGKVPFTASSQADPPNQIGSRRQEPFDPASDHHLKT